MEARFENPPIQQGDGRLWAIALLASLLGNVVILGLAGLAAIQIAKAPATFAATATPPPAQATLLISPELFPAARGKAAVPVVKSGPTAPKFARTSEDQRGKRPEAAAFIGERDTKATSDRAPDPSAKPLPSQSGIAARHEDDIETTESRYEDGKLEDSPPNESEPAMQPQPAGPAPADSTSAPVEASGTPAPDPDKATADEATPEAAALADLLSGPYPVEVPVSRPKPEPAPPAPVLPAADVAEKATASKPPEGPASPQPKSNDAAFSGNQRKTAVVGSISLAGRSALDVADSPLGRYQAVISRAVELEWQRNCTRHRDFITPGYLTVRFFVEPSGRVRTVRFVGEMETGEVQKGFTLNSIRDATIPPMPPAVKKDFAKEPLELIFNFYF